MRGLAFSVVVFVVVFLAATSGLIATCRNNCHSSVDKDFERVYKVRVVSD
jgi:hypothetical protein